MRNLIMSCLTAVFLVSACFVLKSDTDTTKTKNVVGGSHESVSFKVDVQGPFTIIAHAVNGWKIKTAKVSNSSNWECSYTEGTLDSKANSLFKVINPETFMCTLSGDLIPPPPPGGPGPIDYSVTGTLEGVPVIVPPTKAIACGDSQEFKLELDGKAAVGSWTIEPEAGTSFNPDDPGDASSVTVGSDYEPGTYKLEATPTETETEQTGTATLTVVGVGSVSAEGVTSSADNANNADMATVAKGDSGATVTVTAESAPEGEEWPKGYPTWSGASGQAGSETAEFSIDTTTALEGSAVSAACGSSEKFIRIVVVGLDSISGPDLVAVGTSADYSLTFIPPGVPSAMDYVLDDVTFIPESAASLEGVDSVGETVNVMFNEASDDCDDPVTIKASALDSEDEVTTDVLVAEVFDLWSSDYLFTIGESVSLTASSNLEDTSSATMIWPSGYPLWKVAKGEETTQLSDWTGKDGWEEDLSYALQEYGTYTFTASCGSSSESVDVTVVGVDLAINGIDEDKEDNPGGLLLVNDDDDNNNGIPDYLESGSDPDLLALHLRTLPEALTGISGTVSLSAPACVTIWQDASRQELSDMVWEASQLPVTVYVEGVYPSSNATLTLELELENGKSSEDSVDITVFTPDIEVNSVDEFDELSPGVFIGLNNDDDNGNDKIDLFDSSGGVENENDLLSVKIGTIPSHAIDVMKELKRGQISLTKSLLSVDGGNVSFWKDSTKKDKQEKLSWDFSETNPDFPTGNIYMEGTSTSIMSPDLILNLNFSGFGNYTDNTSVTVINVDMTAFEPQEMGGREIAEFDERDPGLFIMLNNDADGGLTDQNGEPLPDNSDKIINGDEDKKDMARLILWNIRTTQMPDFFSATLKKTNGTGNIRIFGTNDQELLDTSKSSAVDPDVALAIYKAMLSDNQEFRIEGLTAGSLDLVLECLDGDERRIFENKIHIEVADATKLLVVHDPVFEKNIAQKYPDKVKQAAVMKNTAKIKFNCNPSQYRVELWDLGGINTKICDGHYAGTDGGLAVFEFRTEVGSDTENGSKTDADGNIYIEGKLLPEGLEGMYTDYYILVFKEGDEEALFEYDLKIDSLLTQLDFSPQIHKQKTLDPYTNYVDVKWDVDWPWGEDEDGYGLKIIYDLSADLKKLNFTFEDTEGGNGDMQGTHKLIVDKAYMEKVSWWDPTNYKVKWEGFNSSIEDEKAHRIYLYPNEAEKSGDGISPVKIVKEGEYIHKIDASYKYDEQQKQTYHIKFEVKYDF